MRLTTLLASALASIAMTAPAIALTVETRISPEFQTKLDDDFGAREASVLSEALSKKIRVTFADRGVKADRVVVTIEDAKPNRPTMAQISGRPGLDPMRSISLGGARLSGVAFDASGAEIARFDYRWYESDIENVFAATTWTDARTTFDRFARRFADKLS